MKLGTMLHLPDTPEGKRAAGWIGNAQLALFLLKDVSWVSSWHWFGLVTVVPMLVLALKVTWDGRREVADLIHNIAVCMWMSANVTWMLGQSFGHDGLRPHAKVFFTGGLVVLLVYYVVIGIRRLIDAHHVRHAATRSS